MARRGQAAGMRDGYLRGSLPAQATRRQMDVLAAFVAAGGSVQDAADLVGIRPNGASRGVARRAGVGAQLSDRPPKVRPWCADRAGC